MSEHAITEYLKTLGDLGSMIDLFRPVGTTYSTVDANFNPNDVWGGEWELLEEGYVLLSGSENGSYKVGDDSGTSSGYKEYGENTHTLTVNEMPSHNHTVKYENYNRGTGSNQTMGYIRYNAGAHAGTSENSGGGQAHNIMQKSIAVYCWIRVA